MDKNSPLAQLTGVPQLIKEVLGVFSNAPAILSSPEFLYSMVQASVSVATARDEASRREIIQTEVIRLQRRFNK